MNIDDDLLIRSLAALGEDSAGADEAERRTGNFRAELDRGKRQIHDTDRVLGEEPAHAGKVEGALSEDASGPDADVRFLTVAEVALMMRVSKMTVYRLVRTGELEAIRVRRSFRVPEGAVNRYMRPANADALEAAGRPRR